MTRPLNLESRTTWAHTNLGAGSRHARCALLLYFAAVLAPSYLLRNSKTIRLAGRAVASNRRPLACCATGQAVCREWIPVTPLTCGNRALPYRKNMTGMLSQIANTRSSSVRILGSELGSGAMGIRTPDLLHAMRTPRVARCRQTWPCQQLLSPDVARRRLQSPVACSRLAPRQPLRRAGRLTPRRRQDHDWRIDQRAARRLRRSQS